MQSDWPASAILLGEYEWMLGRWAFKFGEFFFPIGGFIAVRFEHVIPQAIRGNCISLLTQMKAINGHVRIVVIAIWSLWESYIPQKWLIDNGKIVFLIEFIQIGHFHRHLLPFCHNVEEALTQMTEFEAEHTRTLEMIRRYTLFWLPSHLINYFHAYWNGLFITVNVQWQERRYLLGGVTKLTIVRGKLSRRIRNVSINSFRWLSGDLSGAVK